VTSDRVAISAYGNCSGNLINHVGCSGNLINHIGCSGNVINHIDCSANVMISIANIGDYIFYDRYYYCCIQICRRPI